MNEHPPQPAGENDAWSTAAAAAAQKAGRLAADEPDSNVWARLAGSTVEGVSIPPLGTPSRAAALPTAAAIAAAPGAAPFLRGNRATGGWDVRALIAGTDPGAAHHGVLTALKGGATSLWLMVGDGGIAVADLAQVLAGVPMGRVPIVLGDAGSRDRTGEKTQQHAPGDNGGRGRLAAAGVLAELSAAGDGSALNPASSLGFDPIGRAARAVLGAGASSYSRVSSYSIESVPPGFDPATVPNELADMAAAAGRLGIRALAVDGTTVHDAGGGDAQEVGYTLAAGAAYLRALTSAGLGVDEACSLLEFRYAVTDEQFASMAKLRAARLAWHRVCELSGAGSGAGAQRQHAVTSRAMMTRYDRHVNMLRTTIATFAAGAGGADAITTLPFDAVAGAASREAGDFSERMARNVSALLLGEAQVADVADPAGGAYAVEMLTANLAEAAWAEFSRIEAAGGVAAALADGSLDARIADVRAERDRRIAHRSQPITGVSEFPDAAEHLGGAQASGGAGFRPALRRWAEPFEALRDHPPELPVLLIRVGTEARASARLLFTENVLAAGGIAAAHAAVRTDEDSPPGDSASAAAAVEAAVHDSGCGTVVFAGADRDYAGVVGDLATAARNAGATAVFLAGRPAHILADLPRNAFDGTVAAGDNALEFLGAVRATLGKAS